MHQNVVNCLKNRIAPPPHQCTLDGSQGGGGAKCTMYSPGSCRDDILRYYTSVIDSVSRSSTDSYAAHLASVVNTLSLDRVYYMAYQI